jgi:hypothetical protein
MTLLTSIYLFNLVLLVSLSIVLIYLMKFRKIKTLRYLFFWFLITLSVTIRMIGQFENSYSIYFTLLSLFFNALSYIFLVHIFREENNEKNYIFTLYGYNIIDFTIWGIALYLFHTYCKLATLTILHLFLTVSIILRTAMSCFKFKRYYFLIMCIFTASYFSMTTYSLIKTGEAKGMVWILNIIATIFGLLGTFEKGKNE